MRKLSAYLNGQPIGTLSEGNDLWSFEYDEAWMNAPDGFDLSPHLPRASRVHRDGGTQRPVQWYFDNLLPEEQLREDISKEARLDGDDAFALLEYLGAESAGSLILLPPEKQLAAPAELQPLSNDELNRRIRNLPQATLSGSGPKRMSLAGAQNKLLVAYRDGALFEPVGSQPSTHILKPNHLSRDYPASVINEFLSMQLARELVLRVPTVFRRYTPEPVYIVERFDRYIDESGRTRRRHIIDACQLLNRPRTFKYRGATLEALAEMVEMCRNRASTRLRLYEWLIFNLAIANNDNHLKNLSFTVSAAGIDLAPAYDLLCNGAYHTRALADERATWPRVELAIELPGAATVQAVTRKSVLAAGQMLGLPPRIGARELDRLIRDLPAALDKLVLQMEKDNAQLPADLAVFFGGERRLVDTVQKLVVPDMLARLR